MIQFPNACPECGVTWYRGGTTQSRKNNRRLGDTWECTECGATVDVER
jgi:predicted RNA-binding Zn-ribbon protein involved in translation (DUF1610 family)